MHDSATLTSATSDAGGSVTYTVYSDNTCTTSYKSAGTKTVTNGVVPDSDSVTFNEVGTFYWQASYGGDSKNNSAKSTCTSETLTVNKLKPSLSTNALTPVTIGSAIHDTATLSGATSDAGGTIAFKVYSDATCSTLVTTLGTAKTVLGPGDYDSTDYTPTSVGTYYWRASYSGDAKNEAVALTTCGATNESSTVNKADSNIATAQKVWPQDSVTLTATAGGTPTGTVSFYLYGPNDATCALSPVFTQEGVALVGGVAATDNTSLAVSSGTAANYRWKVVYGGDDNHNGKTSACTENFTVTIAN